MDPAKHLALRIVFFLAALLASANALCQELDERAAIWKQTLAALEGGDFAALEKQAARFRQERTRTSSGIWKLSLFYAAVGNFFDTNERGDAYWSDRGKTVDNWVKAYPTSPTARIAYAQWLLNYAWSYRGSTYANSVKPENWAPFHAGTESARAYLEKHKKIAAVDPQWYKTMETVAARQSWPDDKFQALLDEALTRHPQFYEIYFAAVTFYSPKWGGDAMAIETFARMAVERTRAQEGNGLYARIYWYASQAQYDDRLFTESLARWSTMRAGIDDVLKTYPDEWNIQNFAHFACLARDQEKTLELMARIREPAYPNVWEDEDSFQRCRTWAMRAVI